MKWQNLVAGLLIAIAAVVVVNEILPTLVETATQPSAPGFELQPLNVKAAPPFKLARLEGGELSLADLKGHVALLYFWATW